MTLKTPKDILPNRKDRSEKFRIVAEGHLDRAREMHEIGHTTIADMILVQIDGGKCFKCGMSFKEVKVDNIFAKFSYYTPTCDCYPSCWHCGKLIIEEKIKLENIKYCPNCHVNIWETKHDLPTAASIEREDKEGAAKEVQRHRDYRGGNDDQRENTK